MSGWEKIRRAIRLDGEDMSWKKIVLLLALFCGLLFAWIQRYEIKTVEGKWGAYRLDRWTGATRVIANNRQTDVDYEVKMNDIPSSHTSSKVHPGACETIGDAGRV
jgi:hypothetical protein